MRKIINGLFHLNRTGYLNRTGCQWRMLPKEYEHWSTTFGYYNRWRQDGTFWSTRSAWC